MLRILYEDDHIIVVWKPAGMESQSSRGFGADMVSEIRRHIHNLSTKPSTKSSPKAVEPYVGVIHRLDKPVSGVMVYAKEKKAAAALSRQAAEGKMKKFYLAVLCGKPVDNVENYVDYLLKDEKQNVSRIVDMGITGAKRAELICRTLRTCQVDPYGLLTLAEVELLTGRHHQIRVQMAGHGLPLWGDNRYNPQFGGTYDVDARRGAAARNIPAARNASAAGGAALAASGESTGASGAPAAGATGAPSARPRADVALAAYRLTFLHPVTGKMMTFEQLPESGIFREFQKRQSMSDR